MFAHIGEDYVVNSSELLLIMSYDIFMSSEDNLRILESLKNEDRLVVINDDLKKSIIILEIDGRLYAIVSPVSSTTIAKRFLNFNYYVDNYLDES
ncbi:hypothetical protein Csac_0004 [Caldicellulosiruptor saccharolyticus DSM 8903]|uniref:DUF370 domain-containing protein n=1 Tax=Caldicellulosiruptor saccharolyticus (strain ATCC 43494 / DSM 8903 / Tp8T 6331) TaxID=351627 RepID=A4XFI4_CALS8|nr:MULTISPECIES: extracellular matrix/biofilm biosynthesis regulator RemA family protein [Caldicellulosiruptor]ABP65669.1 hypothetical protein Csac_0004 [Caldicellulosiruptor saccharolyticus DSM 8903]